MVFNCGQSLPPIWHISCVTAEGQNHQENMSVLYTPLNPTFIQKKRGFAGVYLIFLFLIQNILCGYSLEPPRRGGSNVYALCLF